MSGYIGVVGPDEGSRNGNDYGKGDDVSGGVEYKCGDHMIAMTLTDNGCGDMLLK